MQRFTAAIFDMDGLMLDTERLFVRVAVEVAEQMRFPITEEHIIKTIGLNEADTTRAYLEFLGGNASGLDDYQARMHEAYDDRIRTEEDLLKPGVCELLRHLRGKGLKMAVATSTRRERTMRLLNRTGLLEYFGAVVCGDEVERGKPDPAIFLLACEKLGVEPDEPVIFEDSVNGLRAAIAAGIRCVLVPDLIRPAPELERLAYAVAADLFEVLHSGIV